MLVGLSALGAWTLVQRVYYAFEDAKSLFFRQTLRDGSQAEPKLALCLQALENEDVFSSILAETQSRKLKGPDRVSFSVGGEPVECVVDSQ